MKKKAQSARKTIQVLDKIAKRHLSALNSNMTAEEEAQFNAAIEAETAAACNQGQMREAAEMAMKRLRGARRSIPKTMRETFAKALEFIDAAMRELESV